MGKLSKHIVNQAEASEKDYFIWDDVLPGFGLLVFKSGKRSTAVHTRRDGRDQQLSRHASGEVHQASWSSCAFASCRSGVSKPSVNQPYTSASRS